MSPQKSKKKRITSTSFRPRLSEEGKPSTAALPGKPTPRPWPTSGLVTTLGFPPSPTLPALPPAESQSHFTLGVGCGPQSALLRTCSISGKKIYVLYVAIFPRAPVFFFFKARVLSGGLMGGGKCKPELLLYLKVIKLYLMQTACLLLPPSISRITIRV